MIHAKKIMKQILNMETKKKYIYIYIYIIYI